MIKKIILINFLFAFCLINLPPFYYIPFLKNSLFHSYSLSRILILLNSGIILYLLIKRKIKVDFRKNYLILFSFFFVSQSISIINSLNISQFLYFYKDLLFVYLFIFQSLVIVNSDANKLKIIKILLITSIINIFFMLIIYFLPEFSNIFLKDILHDKYLEVLNVNKARGKYFIEFIDFAFIPLFFLFFILKKKDKVSVFLGYFFIILLIFLSTISNFRTHLLMIFFSLIGTVYFLIPKRRNFFLFLTLFSFFIVNFLSIRLNFSPQITIERVSLSPEELGSIIGRFNMWNYALEMFKSSPLTGIGLGNYYDYLPNKEKEVFSIFKEREILNRVTLINPHSIFFWQLAETGILGIFAFICLLFSFLKSDLNKIKSKNYLDKSFLIAFWSLFLYAVFNPPIGLRFQVLFFLLKILDKENLSIIQG